MKRHVHNRIEVLNTQYPNWRMRPNLGELKKIIKNIDRDIPDSATFTNEESHDHKTWSFVWDEEK